VLHEDGDNITVLFDEAGYRTLSKHILDDPTAAGSLRPRH